MKMSLRDEFAVATITAMAIIGGVLISNIGNDKDDQNNKNKTELTTDISYNKLAQTFEDILDITAQSAVTNPDMAAYGMKAVTAFLDSLNNKYNANLSTPNVGNATIATAAKHFASIPQLAKKTRTTEQEFVNIGVYAINKMLKEIDPHAKYMRPDTHEKYDASMTGNDTHGGFGFAISKDKKTGYIAIRPHRGTPASEAGLQEYDLITKIDGKSVKRKSVDQCSKSLEGKIGESSTFTVKRGGHEFDVTLTREEIHTPNVHTKILDHDTGYIRLDKFQENSGAEVRDAIIALQQGAAQRSKNLTGYILDLRDNRGGRLNAAREIADLFLDTGTIFSMKSSRGILDPIKAKPGDIIDNKPLTVLISGYSASASELVTSALIENERATVIGLQSYGKGTAQSLFPLRNKDMFKITTDYYLSPTGASLQNIGIKPDIKVAPADTIKYKKEADFGNALVHPQTPRLRTETSYVSYYNPKAQAGALKQEFKRLNGDPDATLITAIEWLDQKTGDKKPSQNMQLIPLP